MRQTWSKWEPGVSCVVWFCRGKCLYLLNGAGNVFGYERAASWGAEGLLPFSVLFGRFFRLTVQRVLGFPGFRASGPLWLLSFEALLLLFRCELLESKQLAPSAL